MRDGIVRLIRLHNASMPRSSDRGCRHLGRQVTLVPPIMWREEGPRGKMVQANLHTHNDGGRRHCRYGIDGIPEQQEEYSIY